VDETVAREFPVVFEVEDVAFRAPRGWIESPEPRGEVRAFQVESPDGRQVAWTFTEPGLDRLGTYTSFLLDALYQDQGFPEGGIGRGRPEPIDIPGADKALLSRITIEGKASEAYTGRSSGAIVTARDGDTIYGLQALAPESAESEELVEALVQTLRISE